MRLYIVEDDISVINILEDIIENYDLGEICGDCGGEIPKDSGGWRHYRHGAQNPGR